MSATNMKVAPKIPGYRHITDHATFANDIGGSPQRSWGKKYNEKPQSKKPIEQLNALFIDYEMALDAAASAQRDVVIILRAHLHSEDTLPPAQMQAAANDLWYCAAKKKAALEEFYTLNVQ